ncbi:hypothetical protein PENTCL1PPCAC_28253, partial [Pristionchus entomophagus]
RYPHHRYVVQYPLSRPLSGIAKGPRDGKVSANGDHAQIHDRGSAQGEIEDRVDAAEKRWQNPLVVLGEQLGQSQWHHNASDEEVRNSQGHQQEVGGLLEGADQEDGQTDHRVARHRTHDHDHHEDDDGDRLSRLGHSPLFSRR